MRLNNRGNLALMILLACSFASTKGQEPVNTAKRMMQEEQPLTIGGYGQIDYNQPVKSESFQSGVMDVHRMVLMFGYKFNKKTQFITEIEIEHVKEVFVEQAFLQYEISPRLKFRGGLMLIPMGIVNEYHEPSTFNGVERPNLDKYIVPSTWREIGAGFSGAFPASSLSYQIYVVNGFNGYDGDAKLGGANGFRSGRQKGAESYLSSPNVTFRINYFGFSGLQLGISGYSGSTQSTAYDGLDKSDEAARATADSTVVGLSMLGADAKYTFEGFSFRVQMNYGFVTNSSAYNEYTGSDLGSAISGWYGELSYNILHQLDQFESELIPFFRYEQYNTHASVDNSLTVNPDYNRSDITFGVGWKITSGAMLKADYQLFRSKSRNEARQQFNVGVAVWF